MNWGGQRPIAVLPFCHPSLVNYLNKDNLNILRIVNRIYEFFQSLHVVTGQILVSIYLAAFFIFLPCTAWAEMQELTEDKMSQINAGSGLTLFIDTRVLVTADTIGFSDTDSDPVNWILFNGFSADDGSGQGFEISTMDYEPFVLDIGTMAGGRTLLQINLTPFANPFSLHADQVEFCGQPLGSMDLNGIEFSPSSLLRFSHHMEGSSGVEWDAGFAFDIESFDHTYNSFGDSFSMEGIHVAGSAVGTPEDPLTWEMNGNFRIGDFDTQPAAVDIGSTETGQTSVIMSLPMSGSIRVENISLNGKSFGPMVIDDITAHRLTIGFGLQ